MNKPDSKEILETIVEKYKVLKSFGFFEHVVAVGLGFRTTKEQDAETFTVEFDLPEEEKVHAFVNTLRIFTLEKQPVSIPALRHLLLDESISKEWRNKASDLRTQYIAFMEAFPPSVNDLWGKRPTHQEIFDVMVYGNLVKVNNPDKRAKYKEWTKDDIRKFVLQQEFTKVMLAIYAFVADLADITVLELSKPNKDSASLA